MDIVLNSDVEEILDHEMIDAMVKAAHTALERTSVTEITTMSEILSATFTLLDRTLLGVRDVQPDEDRAANAREITRALNDLLMNYGRIPS